MHPKILPLIFINFLVISYKVKGTFVSEYDFC